MYSWNFLKNKVLFVQEVVRQYEGPFYIIGFVAYLVCIGPRESRFSAMLCINNKSRAKAAITIQILSSVTAGFSED